MPSDPKEVSHESMHGQESLRLSRRFKLSHLRFASIDRVIGCEYAGVWFLGVTINEVDKRGGSYFIAFRFRGLW